jgi:hypothetical protein
MDSSEKKYSDKTNTAQEPDQKDSVDKEPSRNGLLEVKVIKFNNYK